MQGITEEWRVKGGGSKAGPCGANMQRTVFTVEVVSSF